jgi:hypothetical protein
MQKCGDKKSFKILVTKLRDIQLGLYQPDLKAHRHLTKPLHRFGMEKHMLAFRMLKTSNIPNGSNYFEKIQVIIKIFHGITKCV